MPKKAYQKVPLAVNDDDPESPPKGRVARPGPEDELTSSDNDVSDAIQMTIITAPSPSPATTKALATACHQLINNRALARILNRTKLVLNGYYRKYSHRHHHQSVTVQSLSDLSSLTLDSDGSVTVMDYIVRQVYTIDCVNDGECQSVTAPSLLASLTAIQPASLVKLSQYDTESESLVSAVIGRYFDVSEIDGTVGYDHFFRIINAFIEDFKYSEIKLGVKTTHTSTARDTGDVDDAEVVESISGFIDGDEKRDANGKLIEEEEAETLDMKDFIGDDLDASSEDGDDSEEEVNDRKTAVKPTNSHRTAATANSNQRSLCLSDNNDDDDELDEIRLDDGDDLEAMEAIELDLNSFERGTGVGAGKQQKKR